MPFRFLVGFFAALVLAPTATVLAVGGSTLLVADLPGYVHVPSTIDGEINGATLVEATGNSADGTALDEARSHTGAGRSWRSSDTTSVAIVLVLDYGSEAAAANLATRLTIGTWQNGTPFDSGLSGSGGVSASRDGVHTYSVFWRQGTHIVATTVSGPDATRAATDVTLLARLEAETLQNVIGGERTTFGAPDSTKSTRPKTTRRTDLTWIVASTVATILATFVTIVVLGNKHRPPPLPDLPPLSDGRQLAVHDDVADLFPAFGGVDQR